MAPARNSILLLALIGLFAGCIEDNSRTVKATECSVSERCEDRPNLKIRLSKVETFYFEEKDDQTSSAADFAEFDYNNLNQWIGGRTLRKSESDFDYIIKYDKKGRMSSSKRVYYDDLGNEATLILDYFYQNQQLDKSESSTVIEDVDEQLVKTIDEVIDYTFIDDQLDSIIFLVNDSEEGYSSFTHEIEYDGGLLSKIRITNHTDGKPDFVFKTFDYDNRGRVNSSVTYRLKKNNEREKYETISYEYYSDGPLKQKTSIINSQPEQKVLTFYYWESGECATNQTFGDRLFPTPEVPNFPCL